MQIQYNNWQHIGTVLLTLSLGFVGASIAPYLYLPVPALLGSALLIAALAFTRLPLALPLRLRNIGFTILGCSMGSGITPEMLQLIGQWPVSLVILGLTVIVMMVASTWVLSHYFGQTRNTALLASTPGALSAVIALASSGYGDARAVVVLQTLRLLVIMSTLPLIIDWIGLHGHTDITVLDQPSMSWPIIFILVISALGFAWLLDKLKVPAAYILAGLLLSGLGHSMFWLQGGVPTPLLDLGFIIIGCLVGVRFRGIQWLELKRYTFAALVSVTLSTVIAAVAAAGVASWLNLPFGQVWVAYAPGGIEAMAALALALNYDPAYIAAHHLMRIIGINLCLPLIIKHLNPH